VLVRQVLGAVSQFEKASLVAKLAAARQRRQNGKCEGRKGYRETHPMRSLSRNSRSYVSPTGARSLSVKLSSLAVKMSTE